MLSKCRQLLLLLSELVLQQLFDVFSVLVHGLIRKSHIVNYSGEVPEQIVVLRGSLS